MKKRLPLSKGTVLQSRYRILRQLGHGGMGAVYEAADARFKNHSVALKQAYADSDETRRAFEREAQLLTKTEHEAFPRVMDYFTEGDGYFLVMELIRGRDLADLLKEKTEPFRQEEVLAWADQILDALEDLHSNRIIHRDIKPSNLKLTPKGRLKLLDFGIAKGYNESDTTKFTTIGSLAAATLQYAPLEQVLKANIDWFSALSVNYPEKTAAILQKSTDTPSDLYALCATLYQLLTNQLPVNAPTRALAIWAGLSDKMLPPHEINPHISPQVSSFLQKGLELDLKNRFQTAQEMRAALQKIDLTSSVTKVIAEDNKKEFLTAENDYLLTAAKEDQVENTFNIQNSNSKENYQIVETNQSEKQLVVDLSGKMKSEEISIVNCDPHELPSEEIVSLNCIIQEPITEIRKRIPLEESLHIIQEERINAPTQVEKENAFALNKGNRFLINPKKRESGLEPKLLFQHQGAYNNSGRTLMAFVSACVITVLCVVIGLATFQQSPEAATSGQSINESTTYNTATPVRALPVSIKQKDITVSNSDRAIAKKKIDSSNLKSVESTEKIKPQTLKRPAKPRVDDAKRPARSTNEKKAKLNSSQNSDCIFDGKC